MSIYQTSWGKAPWREHIVILLITTNGFIDPILHRSIRKEPNQNSVYFRRNAYPIFTEMQRERETAWIWMFVPGRGASRGWGLRYPWRCGSGQRGRRPCGLCLPRRGRCCWSRRHQTGHRGQRGWESLREGANLNDLGRWIKRQHCCNE